MFIWTTRPARAEAVGAPTPLLKHLAGEFAPRIAGLWPEPHRPFVEAPSERRHLVCVALSQTDGQLDPDRAALAIRAPLRGALKRLIGDAPEGLARALQRLGEVAWPAEDYRRLLVLLDEPQSAKVLRHADAITGEEVARHAALLPALRGAGLGRAALTSAQAAILGELHIALVARDGPAAADGAARRWAKSGDIHAIFREAERSIRRRDLKPPFADTERLRWLCSLSQIDEAGGRYKNCLATLTYAGDPDYAYYEWLGEPGVLIELHDDRLFGWTLWQARCAENEAVPEAARDEITFALRACGVHVGRGAPSLAYELQNAALGETQDSIDGLIRGCFGG